MARTGLAHRLYTGDVSFDFVGRRKLWYLISGVILAICILAILLRGLNLSIDFKGGSEFTVPVQVTATTVDEFTQVVQDMNLPDNADIKANSIGDSQVRIAMRALSAEEINQVTAALATKANVTTEKVTNNLIGASWGEQITRQGLIALVVFLALVSLLIWAYFRDWKMAVAAIVALLHDLVLTVGVYAILQFPFTPASLIGILTILGYSLYDTVVVFDKVRENVNGLFKQERTYTEAANTAVNQVLVRSLNTTIIGVLPVAALLAAGAFILGVGPLKDLGLALFVGMIAGAYSSIFLAVPMLTQLREAEPAMKDHRERLERRKARRGTAAEPAKAAASVATSAGAALEDAVGVLTADEIRAGRQQPTRNTRSKRRKDTK